MSSSVYNVILYNEALYGGGVADPVEPAITWGELLAELYPRLHAADAASLTWWTEADLTQWANEALQMLARGAVLFVRRDTSIVTVEEQREYPLPTRHIATLHVAYNNQPLQPTDRASIDALDYSADIAVCDPGESPTRWYEDTLGLHTAVGLYPSPYDARTVAVIFLQQQELLTGAPSTMAMPRCFGAFVEDSVLAEAWGHDSDFAMPELAAHFREKRDFFMSVFQAYWGAAN